MDLDTIFEECEYNVRQIEYFDPEPFYVRKFLIDFLNLIDRTIKGILEEANIDFGLFLKEFTLEKFEERAIQKNETLAMEFVKWFHDNYEYEHSLPYTHIMNLARKFLKRNGTLPLPTIKLISKNRYEGDPSLPIPVQLKDGKIISKADLDLAIKMHSEMFLNLINSKRKEYGEPLVTKSNVIPATFLILEDKELEIVFTCQLYLSTLRDLISDSRSKINENLCRN